MKELAHGFGYWFAWIITIILTQEYKSFDDYMCSSGWRLIDSGWWGRYYSRDNSPFMMDKGR